MDYEHVNMQINCQKAGLPKELWEGVQDFRLRFSAFRRSNSTCGHLGGGWFILYDFPRAEAWINECHWKVHNYRCFSWDSNLNEVPGDYNLIHFEDASGAMEMKLRWC